MSLKVKIKKRLNKFTLDIDFETSDEQCLGILGASGSGKSMTLKCIAGIAKPDSGFISVNGTALFDSGRKINVKAQKRAVGFLFQNYALFPNMTVAENIGASLPSKNKKANNALIDYWIKKFELDSLENAYPAALSGGQQQRAALARMLINSPRAHLLDEPFSALDENLREAMQFEFLRLFINEEVPNTVLVSHSRDEIYKLSKNILIIDSGKIIARGGTRQVFKNPGTVRAARLTGCKNISKIKRVSENAVYAEDWGVKLELNAPFGDDIKAVGVRAHSFFCGAEGGTENCNVFDAASFTVQKGLFEDAVIFTTPKGGKLWYIAKTPAVCERKLFLRKEDILLLRE